LLGSLLEIHRRSIQQLRFVEAWIDVDMSIDQNEARLPDGRARFHS
jgi:hypothetical protein